MARIDRYRLRRLEALEKAAADVAGLAVQFRAPAATVLRKYAAHMREERQRRAKLRKELATAFAFMLKRWAKAVKAQRKREAAYNDAIGGDDKLEQIESWHGPRDLAADLRELLGSLSELEPPTAKEFAESLKTVIGVSDHSVDYLASIRETRKRIARRKGAR